MKTNFKNLFLTGVFITVLFPAFSHWGTRGTFGGTVTCSITTDTAVFIGTANGGVFRSTNSKLQRWTAMPVGLTSGKISALAHTGRYLFAATQDSGIFIYTGFKGNDRYWIKKNAGLTNLKITSLVALDSITLLAGTNGGGVYKTIDKGNTWTTLNTGIVLPIEISKLVNASGRIFMTSVEKGIFVLQPDGSSWVNINDSQTNNTSASALSFNASNNGIMVVSGNTLYGSGNAITSTSPTYFKSDAGLPSGTLIRSIANDGANWYLATDKGVFTSPASVINWVTINTGLKTLDVNSIIPFRNNLVAGTSKEGIFKSVINTFVWSGNNQYFTNIQTFSHATIGANLTIEATEKGVFLNKNLDTTHIPINKGLTDSLNVNDVMIAGTFVFAATKNSGVFMSTDTGKVWVAANSGLVSLDIRKLYSFGGKKYAISEDNKIFSSLLSSETWTSEQFNLPLNVIPTSLTFYNQKMILTTNGRGVYEKRIAGFQWASVNNGLTNLNITSSTLLNGKAFVGTSGSGVFVSDTSNYFWNKASIIKGTYTEAIGLNGENVQSLGSNSGYVLAGYKGGIMASSDNGVTWIENLTQFNLPSYADIHKITFTSGTASRAFVSTPHNSIYSNAISELPNVLSIGKMFGSVSENSMLITPNPNSGIFKLSFSENVISVSILNQNGMEVASQKISIDQIVNINLPSGIYLVKANTLNGVAMQKLVIR